MSRLVTYLYYWFRPHCVSKYWVKKSSFVSLLYWFINSFTHVKKINSLIDSNSKI